MSKREQPRVAVRKMYKLFINGAFVRSESGRSEPLRDGSEFAANIALGSRKDVRDAVVAARAAQPKWWASAPSLRGLVLYRLAEMLETRSAQFAQRLGDDEVVAAIDRIVWYAGWCDKYSALLSTRNPVGGPYFNFSTAEPMGVAGIIAPDEPPLLALVSSVLPALVAGNAVVLIASQQDPRTAMDFSEVVATSDVPPGVLNVITGHRDELAPILAGHMDVDALAFADGALSADVQTLCAENVKRTHVFGPRRPRDWFEASAQSLDEIAAFCEIKTIWHPSGI